MTTHEACSPPSDWDLLEQHIRGIVMPLFRQVAEAARSSGHYAIAAPVVIRILTGTRPNHEPFVTGAFLGLARHQPALGEDYPGSLKVVPAAGTAFLVNEKAPAFDRIKGAALADLTELRLIGMVREVLASTFYQPLSTLPHAADR